MAAPLVATILMAGALTAVAAAGVAVSDIKVTFVDPPARPAPDVPPEARRAGTEPDPDAGKGGASGVQFGIVRDPGDHGPLARVVDGHIAALVVTWSDGALFRTDRETEQFLRSLLALPLSHTFVPWAQVLGVPSVVAAVEHTEGTSGSWRIWYSWPSIYYAYRDGRGRWWFGYWYAVEGLRLDTGGR